MDYKKFAMDNARRQATEIKLGLGGTVKILKICANCAEVLSNEEVEECGEFCYDCIIDEELDRHETEKHPDRRD